MTEYQQLPPFEITFNEAYWHARLHENNVHQGVAILVPLVTIKNADARFCQAAAKGEQPMPADDEKIR